MLVGVFAWTLARCKQKQVNLIARYEAGDLVINASPPFSMPDSINSRSRWNKAKKKKNKRFMSALSFCVKFANGSLNFANAISIETISYIEIDAIFTLHRAGWWAAWTERAWKKTCHSINYFSPVFRHLNSETFVCHFNTVHNYVCAWNRCKTIRSLHIGMQQRSKWN